MTTPTPTADLASPGARAPAGLPDPATLARLANTFFASLPGQAAVSDGPVAAPASPFYFVGDGAHGWHAEPQSIAPPSLGVTPQAYGLPGEEAWRELLALTGERGAAAPGPAASGDVSRYFIDENRSLDTERRFAPAHPPFDVNAIRRDFPILQERVNGKPLVWFDNAATTHKPQAVIDRLAYFYAHENSNIHRAAHALAGRATDAYEQARDTVRRFIGASSTDEIVFVRGTTEAINLIAKTWGVQHVGEGDEIVVSNLEHHANIVPWQQLAAQVGATLRVIPVDDTGQVLLDEYRKLLNDRTRIVSVTQVSNALGTVVPVKEIIDLAHRAGAVALVDGAQSISHMRVDVQALDADFFVFSGHKIYGPTGIGVVYGKRALLEAMPPWQGGGNMIADVTFERTVFQPPPNRFEAGTGNIADAVGLGAALDYVSRVGIELIARYEHDLLAYAAARLGPVPGVRLVGTARDKASVLSFVLKGYETEDVGRALNEEGIAVRSGHHCAQPILRRFGLEATVRPSLAFYNTCEEVDLLVDVVRRLASRR
ncbi:MAG: family 2A encapsulin nanocompartment cargo protein cysteine desulfurase [Burkholderia sp.]